MPIYDYKCPKCKREWSEYFSVANRKNAKCCNVTAEILITVKSQPVVKDYYCEQIDAVITGPRQRARLMKEKGLYEK